MNRGFTLIELMIATLVGAFTVLVAANVAVVVVNQAAKGRQATDFNARARLVGRQMRNDIRLVGPGTTGCVTASPGVAPWDAIMTATGGTTTTGGYDAFPVLVGSNNVGAPAVQDSDVVMMLVANPAAQAQTIAIANQGDSTLTTAAADPSPTAQVANWADCRAVLIVDHSTPSGSGRAQIANLASYTPGTVSLGAGEALQFTVQAQSDVICARISTYWVSDPDGDGLGNYLMRSDMPDPNGVAPGSMTPLGNVIINDHGAFDILAPGIIDLQLAYAFSSEIHGAAVGYSVANAWAFTNATVGGSAPVSTFDDWFEVRQVRFTLHARRMRAIDNFSGAGMGVDIDRAEDGGQFNDLPRSLVPEQLTTAETLVNLRFFDFGLPAGVPAEPY